jgi:hypothetical protein
MRTLYKKAFPQLSNQVQSILRELHAIFLVVHVGNCESKLKSINEQAEESHSVGRRDGLDMARPILV